MVTIGVLEITAVSGRNLKNCETFSKQDPYLTYKLGESKARTKTVRNGGTNPQFDDTVSLKVDNNGGLKLRVRAYDDDLIGKDTIGEAIIDITKAIQQGDFDAWFPIYNQNKVSGELYLELTFKRH
ncbi:hypothetical protein K502DRAFT_322677 [Neoconidiobolus thromboides FSU 785]|nr:hypothetical protein K502DRAFT_322677 [Neoconidiobolus thromboides FSU 785]